MNEQPLLSALELARQLSALPEDTDANDWPHRSDILYKRDGGSHLWATVCLLAIGLTSNPILLAWFMLEFVNGWRRQGGLWDIKLAVMMLDAVKLRIDSLSEDHPRRSRLTVLWAYHAGWVYHPAGEFAKAAECHRISAQFATNERDRLLSLYNAAYEDLNDAIAKGDQAAIGGAYSAFEAADKALEVQLVSGSDEDVRWRLNIACHRLTFAWLCDKECADPAGELARLEAMPQAYADVLPLMRAIQTRRDGNLAEALTHTYTLQVNEKTAAEWHSLTLLCRAELLAATGEQSSVDAAHAAHQEILHLAAHAHGAHLAKALVLQRQSTP